MKTVKPKLCVPKKIVGSAGAKRAFQNGKVPMCKIKLVDVFGCDLRSNSKQAKEWQPVLDALLLKHRVPSHPLRQRGNHDLYEWHHIGNGGRWGMDFDIFVFADAVLAEWEQIGVAITA